MIQEINDAIGNNSIQTGITSFRITDNYHGSKFHDETRIDQTDNNSCN